jgi:hypothetical protein
MPKVHVTAQQPLAAAGKSLPAVQCSHFPAALLLLPEKGRKTNFRPQTTTAHFAVTDDRQKVAAASAAGGLH